MTLLAKIFDDKLDAIEDQQSVSSDVRNRHRVFDQMSIVEDLIYRSYSEGLISDEDLKNLQHRISHISFAWITSTVSF